MHIDETPWLIFSTLNNALELEFSPEFWDIVNKNRKERWGFHEVPWIAGKEAYDVAVPYLEVRMSIFDNHAHTIRVVRPFVWKDTYLKVHPNGAAIFAEDKRLAFLLPLIIEAHELLPATPLFWTNDDKTIPLHRTTLWLHASTIQWIADTGEPYPPELRDEIQPRLDKLRPPQTAKPKQPPQPPKPTRWQERADRPKAKAEMPASQRSALQDPQAPTPSPQQLAEQDKQYMELQAVIASMGQRTLSHTLAEARPEPPPPPPSTKEPKEDAPGTGELSERGQDHPGAMKPTQPGQAQPLIVEVNVGASPILSPTESPDTLTSETVVVSSPASNQEEDINAMDLPILQSRQVVALENVQTLTTQLARAQDFASRITKRLKTMQERQAPPTPPAHPTEDIEMDGMD